MAISWKLQWREAHDKITVTDLESDEQDMASSAITIWGAGEGSGGYGHPCGNLVVLADAHCQQHCSSSLWTLLRVPGTYLPSSFAENTYKLSILGDEIQTLCAFVTSCSPGCFPSRRCSQRQRG